MEYSSPKSLPSIQRESTRRRRLRVKKIYEKRSTQPSGSSTKVLPTFGFPDKSPSNRWVPARKCRQPFRLQEILSKKLLSPRKVGHKVISALIIASLRGQSGILHS
ncbi:hypothetical protein YC2023_082205 [Brassica napus]